MSRSGDYGIGPWNRCIVYKQAFAMPITTIINMNVKQTNNNKEYDDRPIIIIIQPVGRSEKGEMKYPEVLYPYYITNYYQ